MQNQTPEPDNNEPSLERKNQLVASAHNSALKIFYAAAVPQFAAASIQAVADNDLPQMQIVSQKMAAEIARLSQWNEGCELTGNADDDLKFVEETLGGMRDDLHKAMNAGEDTEGEEWKNG